MFKLKIIKLPVAVLMLSLTGCSPGLISQIGEQLGIPLVPVSSPQSDRFVYHTVSNRSETLSQLSRYYTGSAANWPSILRYNPGINPNRLRVGSTVKIPFSIINFDQQSREYQRILEAERNRQRNDIRVSRQDQSPPRPVNRPSSNRPDDTQLLDARELPSSLPPRSQGNESAADDGATPAPRIFGGNPQAGSPAAIAAKPAPVVPATNLPPVTEAPAAPAINRPHNSEPELLE